MPWFTILASGLIVQLQVGGDAMDRKAYEKPELIVYEDLRGTTAAAISN
jgi:hypothetical protein